MAYESFYGGRQGASFVIVKQYASIVEMLAEFKNGGSTTKEVNYGEYVIIDTSNKNRIDNGCVYRRGMDFDHQITPPPYPKPGEDPTAYKAQMKNPGNGAEYIGQIQGPEGTIKKLTVGDYNSSITTKGEYDPTKIVSGQTNDGIKYSQENIEDDAGHIQEYKIGFEFPHFQQDWVAAPTSPYTPPANLIEDITPKDDSLPEGEHATQADRPFYRKYKLNALKGIKGDSVEQICSVPTVVKSETTIFLQVSEDGILSEPDRVLTNDLTLDVGRLIDYENTQRKGYIHQEEEREGVLVNQYAYLTRIATDSQHEGFLIYNYEESAEGKGIQKDGGVNNYIAEIVVTKDGEDIDFPAGSFLLVYYSDPVMRKAIPAGNRATYKGKPDQLNLGRVMKNISTTSIITEVNSLDELYQDGRALKPEEIGGDDSYKGQMVALHVDGTNDIIYAYDYLNKDKWWPVGTFGGGGCEFKIASSRPELNEGGIQGKTEIVTYH